MRPNNHLNGQGCPECSGKLKLTKDIFIKINKNKKQIQTLENLRDTLLPKLLSGEVRMKI